MSAMNSVLIIDDEIMNVRLLMDMLKKEYIVHAEREGVNCVETAIKVKPDLILLDVIMPGTSGFDEIKKLKENEYTKDIPVIFVTGLDNPDDEVRGFLHGAVDYINKPFNAHVVKMRVQHQMRIINLLREVQSKSVTDALTNIGNRRYFNNLLEQEWERAKRQQHPISFIILDIDDFKKFNDTFGHMNGDTALQRVADAVRAVVVRATDKIARWGGEEFAVILPDTALPGAKTVAQSILTAIRDTDIVLDNKQVTRVTVSIGVHSVVPERAGEYTEISLVSDADKAMYHAKRSGKNQACTLADMAG
ncbi:MAG: diguanylate cyclase [Defluviitaleaceae bacterium]|nr:diguanylate cyclase [Defluviitaleaceae bacterium]MCL2239237.1 diguanylate cyclase [Defluviitaleaceae bacterium]MCL2239809.1 diguanylate cyclase [Defluviitaleaceae bacterium]